MSNENKGIKIIGDGAAPISIVGTGGIALETTQSEVNGHVHSIDGKVATETTLGTVHGHVDSIDGKITACNTGAVAGSVTANAGTNLNTSALATETTLGTVHGHVDSIDTKTPALGQALEAACTPVVLPAAQVVTLTPPAAITGFATETTLGTVHGHVDSIDGKITACNTGAVAGSVTANAGTNLNTSALATETTLGTVHGHVDSIDGKITACNTGAVVVSSGAITETNSGSIKTAIEIMDDWDDGADHARVVLTATTAGGCTPYKNLDVDESEDEVKGSAGKLYWIHAMNLAATKRYLKIYNNTAAGVTVGTTVPDLTFPLPTLGDTNGAGFVWSSDIGVACGTGITIAATTGFADNDTGAPGANEVIVNLGYI